MESMHEKIIKTIQEAEVLANDAVKYDIESDFYKLGKYKVDDANYYFGLSKLVENTINEYESTKNIYKVTSEEFDFLNSSKSNGKLTENDRLEFIAISYKGLIDLDGNSERDSILKLEAIDQLKDLHEIVFETKLLELKANIYLDILRNVKNTIKANNEKESHSSGQIAERMKKIDQGFTVAKDEIRQLKGAGNSKSIESNFHLSIFANNGFDVWERLVENFSITESSQTDIKFCFETMKKDGYIHARQADFLRWLNEYKGWNVEKPNTGNFNSKDSKRLSLYHLTIESLKQ